MVATDLLKEGSVDLDDLMLFELTIEHGKELVVVAHEFRMVEDESIFPPR